LFFFIYLFIYLFNFKDRLEGDDLTLKQLLVPLAKSPKFWALLVLSALLTLIRETFNSWTPIYLTEELDMSDGDAATASMVFPLVGTLSAILGGFLVDKISPRWRGLIPLVFLVFLSLNLAGLAAFAKYYQGEGPKAVVLALFLIGMTAMFLIAPYSFLDGVFTLDLAGKKGCAATASIINGAGYIGAILSGVVTGVAADGSGWSLVFIILTFMAVISMGFQALYWVFDLRELRSLPEEQRLLKPT
jgi:OPA family glycerol-3-phosphate transporter-like MFS transporter